MFGWHDDPRVGLATGPGQIDQWQIVGERDQPVPGQDRLERRHIADDVDHRLRSPRPRRHRPRRAEDFQQRVETALGVGAGQQRRRRIRTVQLGAGGDVGAELVFHEPFEDAHHLRRHQRPTPTGVQVDATVDLVHPGSPVHMIGLGVIEGAVGIGEVLPPAHHGAEVLERQMLGIVQQQPDHLAPDAHRSVGCCAPAPTRSPAPDRYARPATPHPPPGTTRTTPPPGASSTHPPRTSWRSPATSPSPSGDRHRGTPHAHRPPPPPPRSPPRSAAAATPTPGTAR